MNTFTHRLDTLRRPGESKKDFARRIGISPVQLSRYYSGVNPGRKVMERIAQRNHVSMDWLLYGAAAGGEDQPVRRVAAKTGRPLSDRDLVDLACSYVDELKSLDRRHREAIKECLRNVINDPTHLEKMIDYLKFLKFEKARSKK